MWARGKAEDILILKELVAQWNAYAAEANEVAKGEPVPTLPSPDPLPEHVETP